MSIRRVKQLYSVVLSSPHLSSPISLVTLPSYPSEKKINDLYKEIRMKSWNGSLLYPSYELPQIHILSIEIPNEVYCFTKEETFQ